MLSNTHFKARKPQALKASGDIHTNWLGTTGAFCLSPGLVGASGGGSTRHTTHTCTDRVAHPRNIFIAGLHYGVHTMWRCRGRQTSRSRNPCTVCSHCRSVQMLQSAAGRAFDCSGVLSVRRLDVMRGNTAYLFVWWSYRIRKLSIYISGQCSSISPPHRGFAWGGVRKLVQVQLR